MHIPANVIESIKQIVPQATEHLNVHESTLPGLSADRWCELMNGLRRDQAIAVCRLLKPYRFGTFSELFLLIENELVFTFENQQRFTDLLFSKIGSHQDYVLFITRWLDDHPDRNRNIQELYPHRYCRVRPAAWINTEPDVFFLTMNAYRCRIVGQLMQRTIGNDKFENWYDALIQLRRAAENAIETKHPEQHPAYLLLQKICLEKMEKATCEPMR